MANDGPPDALPYGDVRAEIDAAARRTAERDDLPAEYFAQLRSEAARFALRTAEPGDLRAAIDLLEEQTNIQALAPIDARNGVVASAKKLVRKAVFFAVNNLAEQTRALGWAATSVGQAAAERIEELEARVARLEARLAPPAGDASPGDQPES